MNRLSRERLEAFRAERLAVKDYVAVAVAEVALDRVPASWETLKLLDAKGREDFYGTMGTCPTVPSVAEEIVERWLKHGRLFGPEPRFDWAVRDLGRVLVGLRSHRVRDAATETVETGYTASARTCLTEAMRSVADAIEVLEAIHILDEDAGFRNLSIPANLTPGQEYTIKVTTPTGTTEILHEGPGAWDDSPRRPMVFTSLTTATAYAAARQRAFPSYKYEAVPS